MRSLLLRFGIDVRLTRSVIRERLANCREQSVTPWRPLARYGIRTVLDIGANTGHFAILISELIPDCRIYSFEPLADCYRHLADYLRTSGRGEAFQMALGEEPGTATIFRNEFLPSSSLLRMLPLHYRELPQTAHATSEEIRVERLDDVMSGRAMAGPVLAKLDVQGFEDRDIRGGRRVLSAVDVVVVECSTYSFYEGQALFPEILLLMQSLGFVYRGNLDNWCSPNDGRILQFDALFEHERLTVPI